MGIRSRSLVAVAVATLVLGATALPSGAHVRTTVGTRTVAASVKAQAVSTAKAKSTRTPVKVVTKKLDDLEVLQEFYAAGDTSEEELELEYRKVAQAVEELEFKKMLSKEEDQLSATYRPNPGFRFHLPPD